MGKNKMKRTNKITFMCTETFEMYYYAAFTIFRVTQKCIKLNVVYLFK